ncbi:cobalamin biosynthesis protein CobW [Amphritea balenae]|uniref:Cobalamin biosynthesis protein CobW n=1 Tax=Amphritea balenae TaxID=452629 RepID=A0A3P1SU99_9GAMM|nr:cobalamin biosynthesis protein CobW [Amphritea balenae]RRD00731.1 cobalamin biosynthesis protein CobW [Amphritea balenae]GGK68248.1 protein CobW [Amphritea balenae]
MQLNKIPTTVVTGFLGSGKTTLLSSVLKQAAGKRIAVIVNEFGELDIDSDLLRNCPLDCEDENATAADGENGFYELANGCICCTVEEEFLPVMQQLVERRDDIDHILIETSGLALPKPLVQAFNWPGIKEYCTVDAVITVIDGPAVAAGRFAHDTDKVQEQRLNDESLDHDPSLQELLDDQLSAADLVVVSKNDLLDAGQRELVQQVVTAKVPSAVKTSYISNGEAHLDMLMGLDAAAEERIDHVHNHHDHHHEHGAHHDHAHDHFDSFVITLGEVDSDKLQAALKSLLSDFNIYRAKGFAALSGKPMRQVFQAVGKRLDVYFDRPWAADESRTTSLVFIGKGIEESVIKTALETALIDQPAVV